MLFLRLMAVSVLLLSSCGCFKRVQYVRNYDGDTATFNLKNIPPIFGREISVRIKGVDTPEIRGGNDYEGAIEARDFLEKLLASADRVDLVNCTRGKYFRIVADIIADGESAGKLLLENGLAKEYP